MVNDLEFKIARTAGKWKVTITGFPAPTETHWAQKMLADYYSANRKQIASNFAQSRAKWEKLKAEAIEEQRKAKEEQRKVAEEQSKLLAAQRQIAEQKGLQNAESDSNTEQCSNGDSELSEEQRRTGSSDEASNRVAETTGEAGGWSKASSRPTSARTLVTKSEGRKAGVSSER
jgi:hypothetical protein